MVAQPRGDPKLSGFLVDRPHIKNWKENNSKNRKRCIVYNNILSNARSFAELQSCRVAELQSLRNAELAIEAYEYEIA